MRYLVFLPLLIALTQCVELETVKYCKSYTECSSVALLEERLCLGNSRKRPYWLPFGHDPKKCHEKLKNDYKLLESLEIQLDKQFNECLIANAEEMTEAQKATCSSKILRLVPRFSFERTITYIPTNCFTGLERRRERECSTVKFCCGSYNKCEHLLLNSTTANHLKINRMNLLQRARDCELGKDVKSLLLPSSAAESNDDEPSWAPSGNVNVRFTDVETLKKQQNKQQNDDQTGFVNVRFRQPKENEIFSKLPKAETPKLNFPNEKLPSNLDDHDKKYEEALKNTNEYKKKLAELNNQKTLKVSSDFINSGLDSLVKAGTLSASTFKEGGGVASGKVEKVPMSELEKESDLSESVVTSSPLILVTKGNKTSNEGCAGRSKITITKTIRYEKILTLLGEEPDSDGVKEIRDLINSWQSNFRKKVVTAKDKAKNKEIEKALEELVSQFDDINLKLIKDQANATFTSEDYPHDDAEITGNNCDALPESTSITETKPVELAELKDENGNVVIIDDGIAKIKIGNEGEISENLDEASRTEIKEEPIEWHNEEYRKEIENFRKTHHINFNNATSTRNDTTCDAYMRCRAQMHVAVDQCAWNFASSKVITSLAESSESLLFKNDEVCDASHISLYEELYEMVIQRNTRLRSCLDDHNAKAFSESICIPYNRAEQQVYDHALLRVLANKYTKAMDCYQDANSIQEKCSKLRQCCPYFDSCREQMIDVNLEQAIISMTARINDEKQSCIKQKARDSFKKAVKGILGRTDEESLQLLRSGQYGLDIKKGAQLMKRLRR